MTRPVHVWTEIQDEKCEIGVVRCANCGIHGPRGRDPDELRLLSLSEGWRPVRVAAGCDALVCPLCALDPLLCEARWNADCQAMPLSEDFRRATSGIDRPPDN